MTTSVPSGVSAMTIGGGAISASISQSSSSSTLSPRRSLECRIRDSSLGQAERALADNVALDFAGAPGDGVLARAEHAVQPSRRIGDDAGGLADEAVGAEQFGREARDAHAEFRAEQLEHRALGSGRQSADQAGE